MTSCLLTWRRKSTQKGSTLNRKNSFLYEMTPISMAGNNESDSYLKVVICGKYKNLNQITKIYHISLKFHRLLIFVILHNIQCKIKGHAV